MNNLKDKLAGLLGGDKRSRDAVKNISVMVVLKGLSVLISFLLVPITIDYVDSDTYGIWLTLSSIVAWTSFFDIGLSAGLKNQLAISLATKDNYSGKIYVSTTYAMLCLIFIPLMVILAVIVPLFDWNSILNIGGIDGDKLIVSLLIIIVYFCNNFILSTINIVASADQKPAISSVITLLQQLFSLIIIFGLTKTTSGNLVLLCIGLCCAPILVNLFSNIILFSTIYRGVRPSVKFVDFSKLPDLMKLGVLFFIIQIAGIIQYQMVNFLIIRNFGPENVTEYNIAFKLFNSLFMVWGILINPLWAAVTDAKAKGDWNWIKQSERKYLKLSIVFFVAGLIVLLASDLIYNIWVGDNVSISFSMSFTIYIYNMVLIFGSLFVNILNGLGELKVQAISSVISPLVFLLVSFLCLKLNLGPISIVVGSIAANFNGFLLAPIQFRRIMSHQEKITE